MAFFRVTVIGEGAWGTAIASHLASQDLIVDLWCYDSQIAESIRKTGYNRYVPHFIMKKNIIPCTKIQVALINDYIFITTPVAYLFSVLYSFLPFNISEKTLIFLCKGIDQETGLLPTQLAHKILAHNSQKIFFLSGPSYAQDVMLKQPTGMVLAGNYPHIFLTTLLSSSDMIISTTEDIVGIQAAAAFKNIIALYLGILDGAGYYDNTKTLVFYKCLEYMQQFIIMSGGNPISHLNIAALGDAILTCWGTQSRNFLCGQSLGKKDLETFKKYQNVEGLNTLKALYKKDQAVSILPFIKPLYEFVFNAQSTVSTLLYTFLKV